MSFAIFSIHPATFPKAQLEEFQVQIISSSYEREGKLITCPPIPRILTVMSTTISFEQGRGQNIPDPCRADGGCLPSGSGCG